MKGQYMKYFATIFAMLSMCLVSPGCVGVPEGATLSLLNAQIGNSSIAIKVHGDVTAEIENDGDDMIGFTPISAPSIQPTTDHRLLRVTEVVDITGRVGERIDQICDDGSETSQIVVDGLIVAGTGCENTA